MEANDQRYIPKVPETVFMSESRKLSTILFADIANYTALMQKEESRALEMLGKFKEVLEAQVSSFRGEIIQYFGDGCLLAFDSATDGVLCAMELQREFLHLKLPIRIGIHLGEVIAKNGNLFGDGVNIASRIESISVPGAVLLSKSVRDQIKNKPEFELQSLGKFPFKNVAEEIEVYGLINEGLSLPDKGSMSGKLEKREQKQMKWPLILAGALVLVVLGFLGVQLLGDNSNLDSEGLLLDEFREKRVAVMVFDNETGDPQYDVFGKMVSDWITSGLMETGTANVINAANLVNRIEELGTDARPEFASRTRIDMMLKGRYYILDGQLQIVSNLINAANGDLIHDLGNIEGSVDDLPALLHTLTQEVLGYWVVKDFSRFSDNPPTYEAYQQWDQAESYWISDPARAREYTERAFELDTTFFGPLISLHGLYGKEGMLKERDSIFHFLSARESSFSTYEKLRFEEIKAVRNKNWIKAAEISEKRYQIDITDLSALDVAINCYNNANYPSKALELIKSFDSSYQEENMQDLRWEEPDQIFPNFLLRNFEEVDRIASSYDQAKIPDALGVMHMQSLVQMDSIKRLQAFYQKYKERGLYNNSGAITPFFTVTIMLCDMLYLMDKQVILESYVQDLEAIVTNEPSHPRKHNIEGNVHFFRGNMNAAANSWEQDQLDKNDWPGWLWIYMELDRLSRVGYCYAMAGKIEKANTYLASIQEIEGEDSQALKDYYLSRIFAGLGENEKAIASLELAVRKGFSFYGPIRFRNDPLLKPLMKEKGFQDLVTPR